MRQINADELEKALGELRCGNNNAQRILAPAGMAIYEAAIDMAISTLHDAETVITEETSDGYHTLNEQYHHRAVLFSVIVKAFPDKAWKSRRHHDGTMFDDMFIVGIETPDGQATYHYYIDPYWEMFQCEEVEFAPKWDGHTPEQAIERIRKLEPVRHGRWIHVEDDEYLCSSCKMDFTIEDFESFVANHCPNCGTKMDAKEEESCG